MHETSNIIKADAPEPFHKQPKGLRDVWYSRSGTAFRRFIAAVLRGLHRAAGELTAFVLGLGIAALWFGTELIERQSTDLTVLRPNIKLWFAEAFNGRDAEFGRLEMAWLPSLDQLVVTIEDAEVKDGNGELLESFDLIRSTLSFEEGLFKRPSLMNAEIQGGVLSFIEDANGSITFGLGPPGSVGRIGPVYRSNDSPAESTSFDVRNLLQGIEFIQINNAKVFVKSDLSEVDLEADVTSLRAAFSNQGNLTIAADGILDQSAEDIPFSIAGVVGQDFDDVKMRLKIQGARPDEITPKKGRFWELQGLAAPVDLTAEVDFSRQAGLRSASIEMDVSKGNFTLLRDNEARIYPLDSLIARASLEPGEERMDVSQLDLNSPNLSFKAAGFLTDLGKLSDGDVNSSPTFNLSAKNIRADITPHFVSETRIKQINLIGSADFDSRQLIINRGDVSIFDSVHEFRGQLSVTRENKLKTLVFKSQMTGAMTHDQVLSLWPVQTFASARDWIDGAILAGQLTQIDAGINLDESYFEFPNLTEDRFKLHFSGDSFDVKYMLDMPEVTGARGSGELIGNRIGIQFNDGNIDSVNVYGGDVDIPVILPLGGDIIINANGGGNISSLLDIANNPPFKIASRYNIEPADVGGQGDVSVNIKRPLIRGIPRDQIDYKIDGKFTGVTAPFKFGQYGVQSDTISLDINRERVTMSGPVNIGPWQAVMSWEETLGTEGALSQYAVSGNVDADVLDNLGLASRSWFDGDAAVNIRAEVDGKDLRFAEFDLDLTHSELSVERIWMKPVGEQGHLLAQVMRSPDSGYIIDNTRLTGAGIAVNGRAELDADFKPRLVDLTNIQIDALIDSAIRIRPDREIGRLNVDLDAEYLDVSAWTEDFFAERQSQLDVPISFRGDVEMLVLDKDYAVTQSEFVFVHSGEVMESASLKALTDGKALNLELKTREDKRRQMAVTLPDASKAVAAFMGLDNTTGGSLNIVADLPAAGEEGPIIGDAEMRDFVLDEAPALAQLLSLASLTGLADTLTGGSMQFDRLVIPFTALGDNIAIRDARLYGPALGMTGDGDVNLAQRVVDFDGTLVPAYTANSFLADIPLIGELFAQEEGGGLFALTYTVNGPFERTQIAVNPLSALTPGFLRGIFKTDRSEIDDALKEAIKDVAPPELEKP